jgi:trimeric autotransporter adhesin
MAAICVSACGSSATTSTATSPSSISRCAVTVNGDGQVPAAGATKSFTVSAARECAWAASVEATWLAIKAGASGQGDGTVEVAAAANPDPVVRRGSVVLNEQRVEVMQAAADCSFSLSEPTSAFNQAGGSGTFEVRTSSALCTWTASSDAPWIAVRSGASGKGNAAVAFDVSASTATVARTGTITAAGLRFTVTQQPSTTQPPPATCSYVAAPLVHTVAAAGGVITVAVTTGPQCPWTAAGSHSWIAVAGPSSFSGPGTATFNVAASSGPARSGTAVVAGQAVAISQGGAACSYTLSAAGQTIPEGGGSGTVVLTTGAACPWSASSTVPWLTITSPASGAGPATVGFTAAAQSGAARTGTLTIGGQTFTVMQAGVCTFAIAPEVFAADGAGATTSIAVTTATGCAWSSSSQAPWLTLRAQGPEIGNGAVQVTVAENRGAARSGTATIAGRTLTVNQAAAPCSYKLDPKDKKVSDRSDIMKIEVETADSCAWTATSNVPWIRIGFLSPGGIGDGVVWIQWFENDGEERVGTVTIGTATFTLTQERDRD